MTIDQRLVQFLVESAERTKKVLAGTLTEAEYEDENSTALMRVRVALTDEDFVEFGRRLGLHIYDLYAHMSQTGHPVPGNDPNKPN